MLTTRTLSSWFSICSIARSVDRDLIPQRATVVDVIDIGGERGQSVINGSLLLKPCDRCNLLRCIFPPCFSLCNHKINKKLLKFCPSVNRPAELQSAANMRGSLNSVKFMTLMISRSDILSACASLVWIYMDRYANLHGNHSVKGWVWDGGQST